MVRRTASERRLAHERLSTGGLARWMRACATHPWRVVGGCRHHRRPDRARRDVRRASLKDEFEIPGSDTQKATDLIESEFAAEQGGVLNLVFAAPRASGLDTPERKAAIEEAIAELKTAEFKPTEDAAGIESVGDPFDDEHVLRRRPDRLRRGAVRPDHLRGGPRGGRRGAGRPSARRSSRPA